MREYDNNFAEFLKELLYITNSHFGMEKNVQEEDEYYNEEASYDLLIKELQNKFFINTPFDTDPNKIQERYLYSIYQAGYEDACRDLLTGNFKNGEE